MKPAVSDQPLLAPPIDRPAPGFNWSGLVTLFWLTLRQYARGRRLLILGLLYLIPIGLVILVHSLEREPPLDEVEFVFLFTLIPHTLMPLTALLYAAGMVPDEVEEQTLTYLVVRPLPKWGIYLTKLLAAMLTTTLLAVFFATLTYVLVYFFDPTFWSDPPLARIGKILLSLTLALVGYCTIFGCLSFFTRWTLVGGMVYIALIEGLLANIDFALRRLTINYYFRVLIDRWLGLHNKEWQFDWATAPDISTCVWSILGASAAATLLAIYLFTTREFRVKTPEGS